MSELEDRLRSAVQAHTADVPTDEAGSLAAIRTRVGAARRRRRTLLAGAGVAAAVLIAAIVVPRLDGDADTVTAGPDDTSSTPSTPTTPETTVGPPTVDLGQALWPAPSSEQRFTDPVDAARSFVEDVIGVDDPPLSDFHEGEPRAGEVDVMGRGEDGRTLDRVVSTVVVRQLDGEHWFVTAALSPDVVVDEPQNGQTVMSPVRVTGRGHGFEGTIGVELREQSASAAVVADAVTTAGSGEALEPFQVDLAVDDAPTPNAILVAHDSSGAERAIPSFTAVLVSLAFDPSPGPTVTTTAPPPADGGDGGEFGYPAVWPFRDQAEVDDWQAAYEAQGTQPWHLDAEQTALSFTTGYLGFTEIDRVVSRDVRATEAWIGVGYDSGSGRPSVAAVVHLVRFGAGADAPWEVVGTRDTDLTLERPRYGSRASSPLTVGGHVSGVDECLFVDVRQPSSSAPIGRTPTCLATGGEAMPWEMTVELAGATDPALTVVVSTGGHVQGVERFAITALRR